MTMSAYFWGPSFGKWSGEVSSNFSCPSSYPSHVEAGGMVLTSSFGTQT